MIQKITLFSGLILSATCMFLHQQPIPLVSQQQYDSQNYNFAYEVNDAYTGDIKNQHESKRGDIIQGQYSLLQPDGVRRTVDYRADDHSGFHASVNNEGRPAPPQYSQHDTTRQLTQNDEQDNAVRENLGQSYTWPSAAPSLAPTQSYTWPSAAPSPATSQSYPQPVATPSGSLTPVAISRTSIVQTITSHGHNNPWA